MDLNKLKRYFFLKLIVLLVACSLPGKNCFAQHDEAIRKIYALQTGYNNDYKNKHILWLVKVKEDETPVFENSFHDKILRRLNKQWFVMNVVETTMLKPFLPLEILPANNTFKLSAPEAVLKTDPGYLYNFIISVTDSQQLKNDLQLYNFSVQRAYKSVFVIKARPSFIIDTLINKEYLQSAAMQLQQPKPEEVINDYDNSTNAINLFLSRYPAINGNGLTASVKENLLDTTDIDFKNRYINSGVESDTTSSHATTMATFIAGGGNSFELSKGIAWAASLTSVDFNDNLVPEDDNYFKQYKITVQNNSYGVGVENYYGADAAAYDESTIDNPHLLYVFSAGNSGNVTPADGNYKGIESFSNLTGSFKQAKNILTVGSIDSFYNIASLSSKGPAYDGRIKPELVAYGNDGSSGAAAITSGTVLAVQSAYQSLHHDSLPQNALAKAIIINSADDVFNPGPDYYSGFGNVNVANAVAEALSNHFFTGDVKQNENKSFAIHIPSNISNLKITLVWNDTANQPNAFKALVNDLDLSLENANDHSVYLPWVLNSDSNPATLLDNAVRGRDSLNNVEQISVSHPPAGDYVVHVQGYDIQTAVQSFYIVYSFSPVNDFYFISPVSITHFTSGGKAIFRWNSTLSSNQGKLEYSVDKGGSWKLINNKINLSKKYYNWFAPDTTAVTLARMTIGNKIYYSDTFDISTQLFPEIGFNCGDSALISWNKQKALNRYAIFSLGDKFMQPIAIVNDSFYIVKNAPSRFIAVAPVIEDRIAIRSYTFNYTTQGVGCYIVNFLADPAGENASLKLYLGTIFNVKSAIFQQQLSGVWTDISKIGPVSNTFLRYDSPLKPGVNIYRAIVTLQDGSDIVSNESSVYYLNNKQYIIFPNPADAKQGFYILSTTVSAGTISLFDAVGRKLLQQKITQQKQHIITSKLAAGVYFAVIYDDDNQSVFKAKIVIY